ncbi:hypothetical protein AVEN_163937-1 [Araneus ventricosus]|uniref:Uncharacterized protein n=1 Tax=Araneus ventricosus TaxID=182803 RepID=A0A4Y2WMG3_ARAVE|nr:hypothetical protein AVEN_163937-1 [Araneus ventricosus]
MVRRKNKNASDFKITPTSNQRKFKFRQLLSAFSTGALIRGTFRKNHPGTNQCPATEESSSQPAAPLHLSLSFQNLHSLPHLFISHFLSRIITDDETWVHNFTPDTKSASMAWKHPSLPVTKKFKVSHPAGKDVLTVFRDAKGVILISSLQGLSMRHSIATPSPN